MVSTALVDTTVQSTERDSHVFHRTFPASLEVFDGHYPGFPIVPGVLLVESCAAAVNKVHGGSGHWTGVRSARFHTPVRPEADVVITVAVNPRGALAATISAWLRAMAMQYAPQRLPTRLATHRERLLALLSR